MDEIKTTLRTQENQIEELMRYREGSARVETPDDFFANGDPVRDRNNNSRRHQSPSYTGSITAMRMKNIFRGKKMPGSMLFIAHQSSQARWT
jgi:hypothetical protein